METNDKAELLTAKKVAEAIGISEGKVKKIIKELDIQPDEVKCRCNYFGPDAVEMIKKAVN